DGRVDGDDEGAVTGRLRASHALSHEAAVAVQIELHEEAGASLSARRDVLERNARLRADDHRRLHRRRGENGRELAFRMRELMQRDGGEQDRIAKLVTEEVESGIASVDGPKHSRADSYPPERRGVLGDGELVRGTSAHVREGSSRHPALRER